MQKCMCYGLFFGPAVLSSREGRFVRGGYLIDGVEEYDESVQWTIAASCSVSDELAIGWLDPVRRVDCYTDVSDGRAKSGSGK